MYVGRVGADPLGAGCRRPAAVVGRRRPRRRRRRPADRDVRGARLPRRRAQHGARPGANGEWSLADVPTDLWGPSTAPARERLRPGQRRSPGRGPGGRTSGPARRRHGVRRHGLLRAGDAGRPGHLPRPGSPGSTSSSRTPTRPASSPAARTRPTPPARWRSLPRGGRQARGRRRPGGHRGSGDVVHRPAPPVDGGRLHGRRRRLRGRLPARAGAAAPTWPQPWTPANALGATVVTRHGARP